MTTAKLRAIAKAATPGPWVADETLADPGELHNVWRPMGSGYQAVAHDITPFTDVTHIATFDPPTVLALLDVVEAADTYWYDADIENSKALATALARLDELLA